MTSILYNDLITLISASNLVPEEQYCITDYVTTVAKANYTSAGYKFDIVVTALTTNTLYEYALLMANESETYFDADALLIYNVKYNVNNIIPGYDNDWVDENGKGCIYYMVDNKGNEAPFDFKNIKYNGNFLFNNTLDGTDASQTVSEYNVVKEVIEDGYFKLPQVSFNDVCSNVSIDTNADQLIITECYNLQIGDNCKNSEITNVNNTLIGNELSDATLTSIDGAEIGDNNNGIIATNQTNLIIKDKNTTITLGGGSNGVIIDSNNTDVIIGTNAKDVYINDSKTIDLGNNIEQFNISSCYDVVIADDCKLFNLNETNHLTATTGCESINTVENDYITLTEEVKNVTVSEGLNNLILDGSILTGTDYKLIIKQDEKVVIVNEQTNSELVLIEDGTTTSNPTSFINDSPSDDKTYGRKNGDWSEIDTSGKSIKHNDTLNRNGDPNFLHVNEEEKALITSTAGIVSGHTEAIEDLEDNKANTSHTHTKSEVGLPNVDNTSDVNKPISNATQTALNSKVNTSHTHNANAITSGDLSLDRLSTMKKYVASRGENLVTNGTGLLKDNTNFSSMTFAGEESYNCDGSFTTTSISWMKIDESMPVDPDLAYKMLYYIKAKPWVGSSVLAGIACFDTDGLEIMPHMTMYFANTLTTLALDLKNGDTTVKFTNLTNNWKNEAGAGTHIRTLIFWNYVDSYGKSYPELTYSRNAFQNSWDPGSVNYTTNTITLNKPWSNGTIVAGTKVSNGYSGGTYKYLGVLNYKPTTEWTSQSDIISGIDLSGGNYAKSFHPGTASVKLVFGLNRDVTGGRHYISNISFGVETHPDAVLYDSIQSLSNPQKTQARTNIGAGTSSFSGSYNDLSNKPNTLGGYGITNAYTKTETDTAINAIEVGGRNLIPNTKDLTGYTYRTSDTYLGFNIARTTRGATGYLDTFSTITPDIAAGSTYVASFYAKASVNTPMDCHWYSPNTTTSSLTSTGNASTSEDGKANILVTTEWKKYWVMWTQTLTEVPKRLIIGRNSTIAGAVLEIAGVKLEKGNKATDWTPALEDQVTDAVTETIPITWSNLRTLRDAGTLAPGQSYKITDYVCRTTIANSWAFNDGLFDIIVTALSSNKLSENASATYHVGDTYFTNAKLESWELKYCLDNDTTRFDWADTTNGKGVIYYMKDEWNNECPYNFKSIKFKKSDVWLYTFGGATDDSLTGNSVGNTIKESILSSKLSLNFNTLGKYCHDNTFGNNCSSNTLGDYCYSNTFGENCYSNTFTYDCGYNTFGENCYSNEFGVECNNNMFGYNCHSNKFGVECYSNDFGDSCTSNTFGETCYSNTFGDGCNSNTFGNACTSNTFGNECWYNTFGNYGVSTNFGNNCYSNNFYHGTNGTTLKNFIKFIVLEDRCSNNNFYSTLTTNYTSFLQRIRIKGLDNTTPTPVQITLSEINTKYEWVIAKSSLGEIEQYCPEDILLLKDILYEKYKTIASPVNIQISKEYKLYKYVHTTGNIALLSFSSLLSDFNNTSDIYTFEMEITMPFGYSVVNFASNISKLSGKPIILAANKKNYLTFRTFDGTNFIVNYQGYI